MGYTSTTSISPIDEQKIPYPKQVFFIVINEFCERFCYYGMRTILSLYLVNILLYSESDAKIIYHTWTMFTYFFPIVGAIISDSWWGKFNTILYVSIIYAIGNTILSVASIQTIGIPQREISILGLLLIALGTGGIKPCVAPFGGDQFVLPQQELQLAVYFSMFYFSINAGSLVSTFLTPVLREDVHCFGSDSCYPLAFAIPGALMFVAIIIFAIGKPLYKILTPKGNVIVEVMKCIIHALKQKMKSDKSQDHWLDYAKDKYGEKRVNDIKVTLKVLVLYTPLPIFWALYDQQGTGWTFQAVRMKGDIGFYTILPDQMQLVNPLLILAFIPLFTYVVYPLLHKCHILRTPLQRMVCGGLLAALAFGVSACLSLALESTDPVLPSEGNGQIRLYNPMDCQATLKSELFNETVTLQAMDYKYYEMNVKNTKTAPYSLHCGTQKLADGNITVTEEKALGYYLTTNGLIKFEDDVDKSSDGNPKIRILTAGDTDGKLFVTFLDGGDVEERIASTNDTIISIDQGTYRIDGFGSSEINLDLGGVYTLLLNYQNQAIKLYTITEENSVHILWLLPQYIIITAAEVMFSVTGLEFSYSQAPVSMKSLLQACWLLTTAVGNLIIVIIESAKIFEKQSADFFLYTGLMVADMMLFAYLAYRYKYVESIDNDDTEDGTELENGTDNPGFKKTEDS